MKTKRSKPGFQLSRRWFVDHDCKLCIYHAENQWLKNEIGEDGQKQLTDLKSAPTSSCSIAKFMMAAV